MIYNYKICNNDNNDNYGCNELFEFIQFVFIIDIITYIIAGYCCFEVSHIQYTRLCSCCHKSVYKICEKISIYQYHKKWDKFIDENPSWKKELYLDKALLPNDSLLLKTNSIT